MARYLKISEFLLSSLLLAFATALPEMAVGIRSALDGIPELSLGDILGTNIANLALILGIVTVLGKGLELKDYEHFKDGRVFTFLMVLSPFVLLLDGELSRMDGGLLLLFFVINTARILREQELVLEQKVFRPHLKHHAKHSIESRREFMHKLIQFVIAVPMLIFGASIMIHAVRGLSDLFGIPEFLLGLFLISVGTSLPELTVALRGVLSHHTGVSLGDLFGASALNSTLILGIVSLIEPITAPPLRLFGTTGLITLVVLVFIYASLKKRKHLYPWEGYVLLALYAGFLLFQLSCLPDCLSSGHDAASVLDAIAANVLP